MRISFFEYARSIGLGVFLFLVSAGILVPLLGGGGSYFGLVSGFILATGIGYGSFYLNRHNKTKIVNNRINEIMDITSTSETHFNSIRDVTKSLTEKQYILFRQLVFDNFNSSWDKRKIITYLSMWVDEAKNEIRHQNKLEKEIKKEEERLRKQEELAILQERRMMRDQVMHSSEGIYIEEEEYDDPAFSDYNYEGLTSDRVNEITGVKRNLNRNRVKDITGVSGKLNSKKIRNILK